MAYNKQYYEANKDRISELNKKYRKDNPNRFKKANKKYYEANKKRYYEANKEYHEANKELYREYMKRYYEANKESHREYMKQYHEANKERISEKQRTTKKMLREKVYNAYGGCFCDCCGESEYKFLTIDHINNDGNKHRKQIVSSRLIIWLINNNYPAGFQVLCYNCNIGKHRNGGICPHKEIK